jgi:glycosyltransferase involved in cell wall biosynthesis
LNILHVTRESGSDARYGIRKSLQPVMDAMIARGHQVTLFDQPAATAYLPDALTRAVERLYFGYLRVRYGKDTQPHRQALRERVHVAWAAVQHARLHGVTHVHCHDALLAQLFHFFAQSIFLRVHWGFTAHAYGRFVQAREGFSLPVTVARHLRPWESAAARNADWVIIPSRSGMEKMAQEMDMPAPLPRWHVVPHPRPVLRQADAGEVRESLHVVPHPRPVLRQADAGEVRESLGVGDNLLVLAIGQLIPIKRFHLLLELLGKLPQPRPHLLILGEGPEEHRLREVATRQGLEDRLHLTTTDDIAPWLAAADIYVSLSSTESWGMANCEALAAGLPAVCSAVGAVPEVVGDGAILVGESPDEMLAALARLVDSPAERALWAERARRQAGQWWSAGQVALALEDIYSKAPGR